MTPGPGPASELGQAVWHALLAFANKPANRDPQLCKQLYVVEQPETKGDEDEDDELIKYRLALDVAVGEQPPEPEAVAGTAPLGDESGAGRAAGGDLDLDEQGGESEGAGGQSLDGDHGARPRRRVQAAAHREDAWVY